MQKRITKKKNNYFAHFALLYASFRKKRWRGKENKNSDGQMDGVKGYKNKFSIKEFLNLDKIKEEGLETV